MDLADAVTSAAVRAGDGRIRVLLLIGTMHIGGAEKVVAHLARRVDRGLFDVRLCCTRQLGVVAEALREDGVEVTLAAPPRNALRHATPWYVRKAIRAFDPHVIHTHSTPSLVHVGPIAALARVPPWIHTFHFGNYPLPNATEMRLERFFCRWPDRLIAVSESQRRSILHHHGVAPERIVTLPNGVDLNPFADEPDVRAARRAEFGFTPDDIVVGSIAVLSRQKGVTYFLQAARQLRDRDPRLKFLVVGGGPLEESLRAEAQALGLGDRVVFTGWRQDASAMMTALDVFVMASLWEAMPLALLEAMAARRPIVVTDVADNRAIADDGGCAVVIPPEDPQAIVEAILRLVSAPDAAAALGQRAYARFTSRYTIPHMITGYEAHYARLAGR